MGATTYQQFRLAGPPSEKEGAVTNSLVEPVFFSENWYITDKPLSHRLETVCAGGMGYKVQVIWDHWRVTATVSALDIHRTPDAMWYDGIRGTEVSSFIHALGDVISWRGGLPKQSAEGCCLEHMIPIWCCTGMHSYMVRGYCSADAKGCQGNGTVSSVSQNWRHSSMQSMIPAYFA